MRPTRENRSHFLERRAAPLTMVLVLLLLLVAGVYSLSRLSRSAELIDQTNEVRSAIADLQNTLVDAETGIRGYVVAGEARFLEPYAAAQTRWPNDLQALQASIAANPSQQERLRRLEALAGSRLEDLSKTKILYDQGARGPQLTELMLDGKARMDGCRALLAEMDRAELTLLSEREQAAQSHWQRTLVLFVGGGFAFLTLVALLWVQRREADANRERAEAMAREGEQRTFLLRAADELIKSLDYEETLSKVAQLTVPSLADWCAVDLVEGAGTKRVAIAHVNPAKIAFVAELERRYPPDPNATTGVPGVIRSGKPEFMSDIPRHLIAAAVKDPEHLRLMDELALKSYVCVPLRGREGIIGALSFVMAESGRRYERRDMEFAQALADRAAMAIENARLLRQVQGALTAEQHRREVAEEATRFAQTFIGVLGHDLRNPLNAISVAANVLKLKARGDTKPYDRILSSASRMATMVDQLLDLTRSRLGGGIPIDRRPGDLAAIVSAVVDEAREANPGREIHWQRGEAVLGAWDEGRLSQVLSNVIGNALEHGDRASPVEVTLVPRGEFVDVEVHNDGPAISEELLAMLFDAYRHTTVRGERSKGLGLGLFITKQIVEEHGGEISVHSAAGDGTTFTLTLPRGGLQTVAPAEPRQLDS